MTVWKLRIAAVLTCMSALPELVLSESSNGNAETPGDLTSGLRELGFEFSGANPSLDLSQTSTYDRNCTKACQILNDFLPHKVFLPGSALYGKEGTSYWSNLQAEQTPYCYITPKTAKQVAGSVLVAEYTNCSFAVRSGGHAAFAGASNINRGFTIDLKKLNQINVSKDRNTTGVGPGNRWVDVYDALTPKNLTVIGGRVSAIGVGGLTLGGGISFFSGRHGWACDNVNNYQLVLGGGRILDVNYTSYPDLYYALRGGGNNFGIVTRFDLATYPQGKMWGGNVGYVSTQNASLAKALVNFAHAAPSDPDAADFVAVAYTQGQFFGSSAYEYAKPVVNPPIFHEFTSIPNITSTMRITTLPSITNELETRNPSGLRETYTTATFAMSAALIEDMVAIFADEAQKLANVSSYLPAVVFQAITADEISHFSKNGGNALGITNAEAPLLLLNIAVMWANAADDEAVLQNTIAMLKRSEAAAKKRGLANKYLYQNYASLGQDVFKSYGEASYKKLAAASRKYDPNGVFQRLQPGYFKLFAPNGGSPT